eukprot:2008312-Prymnesium_polylepis.1
MNVDRRNTNVTLEARGMSTARTRTAKSERDRMHAMHGALSAEFHQFAHMPVATFPHGHAS